MPAELMTALGVMALAATAAVSAGIFMEAVSVIVDGERRHALWQRVRRIGIGRALNEVLRDARKVDELFIARRARLLKQRHQLVTEHHHANKQSHSATAHPHRVKRRAKR